MERKVEHKSVSRQVEEIKALSEDILEYRSIDVQKAWLRMERRVGRQAVRRTLSLLFTRAAVILVLPLLFSSLLFSYLYYATRYDEKSQPVVYAEVNSLPGTITRFVLPDQSVVWLNSGSKLTYPSVFEEKERKVLLSGEGYFEVEADPEHPFCVSTSEGLRVVAYGTKGNYILLYTITKIIKGYMVMYPFIIQSFFSFFFPFPSFLTLQERVFRKRGSRGSVFGL